MTKQDTTTISIYKEDRDWIETQKVHPNEYIRDVVQRLLKQQDKVSQKVMRS